MAFSSVPVYLDHPNWQQLPLQLNNQQGSGNENPQLPPPPTPPSQAVGGGGGCSSIRPGSMVDRARLAKLALPEAGLKCPRCESSNTKFCYFNNYSLTQPRHFCKTCRRYWTRGGALRSVPVGGGCRKSKKNKSSCSKSSVTSERHMGSNSTSASPSNCSTDMSAHQFPHLPSSATQLPLMEAALHNLTQFSGGNNNNNDDNNNNNSSSSINIGSNSDGFQTRMIGTGNSNQTDVGFHIGNNSAAGSDHWRFPFLAGLEVPAAGLFPFQTEVETQPFLAEESQQLRSMPSRSLFSHLAPVKMEENGGLNNLPRQFLGISENNQHWGGNAWTEFSGLNSSSTKNHFL